MLTEDQLRAIEVRCEAATPGPWRNQEYPYQGSSAVYWDIGYDSGSRFVPVATCQPGGQHCGRWMTIDGALADSNFIAHARADIPALIAEVRELRAENERICTWEYDDMYDYYETECDSPRAGYDGTLEENEIVYCPKCGRRVVIEMPEAEADDENADLG